jgi:hypothetical protein
MSYKSMDNTNLMKRLSHDEKRSVNILPLGIFYQLYLFIGGEDEVSANRR